MVEIVLVLTVLATVSITSGLLFVLFIPEKKFAILIFLIGVISLVMAIIAYMIDLIIMRKTENNAYEINKWKFPIDKFYKSCLSAGIESINNANIEKMLLIAFDLLEKCKVPEEYAYIYCTKEKVIDYFIKASNYNSEGRNKAKAEYNKSFEIAEYIGRNKRIKILNNFLNKYNDEIRRLKKAKNKGNLIKIKEIDKKISELKKIELRAKTALVANVDNEAVFDRLHFENTSIKNTDDGIIEVEVNISCDEFSIYDNLPAVVDGSLVALLYQDEVLIDSTYVILPFSGIGINKQTAKGVFLTVGDSSLPYEVKFLPHHLWEIEK